MKRAVIASVLLLGGCGSATSPSPADNAVVAAVPVGVSAAPVGSKLSGSVSSLSGSVTGFSARSTDVATIVSLDADVLFDFDSATLRPDAQAALGKAADAIRQGRNGKVAIIGYTDAKGDDAYNLGLSQRRAAAVAAWMRAQPGVQQRDYAVSGKGEADPVAPNAGPNGADDPAGRAKNRRVELVIPR